MIGPHHSIMSCLTIAGTGRGGVDRDLERRQVVARPHRFRQLQHAREHRRHQLAVGDAPSLDQLEITLRIEALHDDGGAAAADGEIDRGLRCRMIERRRREVDHAFAVVPELVQEIEQRQSAVPAAAPAAGAGCLSAGRWCRTNRASRCRCSRRRSASWASRPWPPAGRRCARFRPRHRPRCRVPASGIAAAPRGLPRAWRAT